MRFTMTTYEPRLIKKYKDEVVPQLMKDFTLKNIMEVPKLEKIIVNMGLGEAVQNAAKEKIEKAVGDNIKDAIGGDAGEALKKIFKF